MPQLTISDLDAAVFDCLRDRATVRGHTAEEEAKEILAGVLRPNDHSVWTHINASRERLAATGRSFGDSAELVREDRDR